MSNRKPRPKLRTLAPVRPSVGFQMIIQRALEDIIKRMHDSTMYWVRAAYRANEPEIAQDELPAVALKRALARLSRRWQKNIDGAAPELAKYFATSINKRSSKRLGSILKNHGLTVEFKMTRPMRDVMNATIQEQVGLIKSIPQQYFKAVEGAVMRSVAAGRDLGDLSKKLENTYGVTKRRAAFIALDQNNKATASMTRVRQLEAGLEEAIWLHSHGGKTPRKRHLAYNGKRYNIAKGAPVGDNNGNYVHPGEEVGCRCVPKPIVPGFA